MHICQSVVDIQAARDSLSGTVALVPTMGNLHAGHLSLIEYAKQQADHVIVSIFVNPMQFGPNEDLDKYPRTLADDQAKLTALGVDMLFLPTVEMIYPNGVENHTQVIVPNLTDHYCGAGRPGHFTGVATIVLKLLTICLPDMAVFGKKDFQQLTIIRKLVDDMSLRTDIIGLETRRDEFGLALSSRNQYLSDQQRDIARQLRKNLLLVKESVGSGDLDFSDLCTKAIARLEQLGFAMEYFSIADQHTLQTADQHTRDLVILSAGRLGQTRLIDNIDFTLTD